MSQFIKTENQSILWNTIQFSNYFKHSNINEEQKIQLFKQIMKQFYEQIKVIKDPNKKLSKKDLENFNKQMIQTYLQQLLKHDTIVLQNFNKTTESNDFFMPTPLGYNNGEPSKHVTFQIHENNSNTHPMSFRPIQPINTKENPMEAFTQRQLEYETMIKREIPQEPNFTEKIGDVAIENMEELLKAQILQRELDLQEIAPASNLVSNLNVVKPTPHTLKIVENNENITMEVLPLQNDNSPPIWFKEFIESMKEMKEELTKLTMEFRSYKKVLENPLENLDEINSLKIEEDE